MLDRMGHLDFHKLNRKAVHFEVDEMVLNGDSYQLMGAIALEYTTLRYHYSVYLRDKGRWLMYEGDTVKIVKKTTLQRICALTLVYHRTGVSNRSEKR